MTMQLTLSTVAAMLFGVLALRAVEPIQPAESRSGTDSMWSHIQSLEEFGELRGLTAEWDGNMPSGCLKLQGLEPSAVPYTVSAAPPITIELCVGKLYPHPRNAIGAAIGATHILR